MKNSLIKKVFGRVSIGHGIIILLVLVLSTFRGCNPKPKSIDFFDLTGGPAPAPTPTSEPESDFEPEITAAEPKPEPKKPEPKKPEPKPEKKLIPKPVVTNKPPETVKTNAPPKPKPVVTNAPSKKAETNAPSKPKTLEDRLKEVRQGGKPVAAKPGTKPGPPIDYSGLRNALNSAAAGSGSASGTGRGGATSGSGSGSGGGMYSPFAGYYDSVKQQMYGVWQQPAGAPIGLTAIATVRVERDGTVSLKSITSRSGNVQFDQSVQNALNITARLPIPPVDPGFDRNIQIEFKLSD